MPAIYCSGCIGTYPLKGSHGEFPAERLTTAPVCQHRLQVDGLSDEPAAVFLRPCEGEGRGRDDDDRDGGPALSAFNLSRKCQPASTGIILSSRIRSVRTDRRLSNPSSPLAAKTTSEPALCKTTSKPSRVTASSSTTRRVVGAGTAWAPPRAVIIGRRPAARQRIQSEVRETRRTAGGPRRAPCS